MTLVELLVVVSILLLLAVTTIPAVRPGLDAQRIREATRTVDTFLSNARNRAEESGRPYGVEFERLKNVAGQVVLSNASVRLYQVEVPPPYAGDYQNSTITITGGVGTFTLGETPGIAGLVKQGDMLKLNYQGGLWAISSVSGSTVNFSTAPPNTSSGLPFQIFRQPIRTMVAPVTMPRGTAVDLYYSGTTSTPQAGVADTTVNPRIVFSPGGSVDRVWWTASNGYQRATDPIYLLIGRRDRVQGGVPPEDGLSNCCDPNIPSSGDLNNFWIAIQPQTGLTITGNAAAYDSTNYPNDTYGRRLATPAQAVGGR